MSLQLTKRQVIIGAASSASLGMLGISSEQYASANPIIPFVSRTLFKFSIQTIGSMLGYQAGKAVVSRLIKPNVMRASELLIARGFRGLTIQLGGHAGEKIGKLAAGWLVEEYLKGGFCVVSGENDSGRKCAAFVNSHPDAPILNEYDVVAIGKTLNLFKRYAWSDKDLIDVFYPITDASSSSVEERTIGRTLKYESAAATVTFEYDLEISDFTFATVSVGYNSESMEGFRHSPIELI